VLWSFIVRIFINIFKLNKIFETHLIRYLGKYNNCFFLLFRESRLMLCVCLQRYTDRLLFECLLSEWATMTSRRLLGPKMVNADITVSVFSKDIDVLKNWLKKQPQSQGRRQKIF